MRKRCTKGKSCGATCIDRSERCVLELGPLPSKSLTKASKTLGGLFNQQVQEKPQSVPADLKNMLAGLGPMPGTSELDDIFADISNLLGSISPSPTPSPSPSGSVGTTGNTRYARGDAEDFDGALGKVRRVGSKSYDGWKDSYEEGSRKIGEGSYGSVIRNKDGTFVKRGSISEDEAALIEKLGKIDLGPKLFAADINGPSPYNKENFVDIKNGRIAMTGVEGRPMGNKKMEDEVGGKKLPDIYWKAMADLHRQGIAHNDAHIDNIMIDKGGKGRWVDLGLAQSSPKAALAEVMGVFKAIKGGDDVTAPGSATGNGNWQTTRWDATGAKKIADAHSRKTGTWKEYQERFPVASKVFGNSDKAFKKLEEFGLDINDINTMIAHGIRSPLSSYADSDGFGRISDSQAKEIINIIYDGI